ncbi:MAG: T9SS type A sorting domain-containing protein [Lewinella sp.]
MYYFTSSPPGRWPVRSALTLLLGAFTLSLSALTAVSPGCGGTTYYQDDSEGNGLVVMEAETSTFSRSSNVADHSNFVLWLEYTSNDAGNGGYVKVNTTNENSGIDTYDQGAELSFDIDFVKTGNHYIFVRFRADNNNNNSLHLEFDGVRVGSWAFPLTGANWMWVRIPVSVNPATTGLHNFSVYHLEDGMDLDRFIISSDPDFIPDGIGPDATEDGSNRTRGLNERVEYHMDYRSGQGYAVLEAEVYTYNMSGLLAYECRPWESIADPSASGGSYMAVAQAGELVPDNQIWSAPLMDYEVSIDVAAEYFVHIRHRSPSESDNSIFVSVDYTTSAQFRLTATTDWIWERQSLGVINQNQGTFLLSIIMREDATPIDKIILTTDPDFVPSGTGPIETALVPARLVYQQDNSPEHLVQLPMETPSRDLAGVGAYQNLQWTNRTDGTALDGQYAVVPNIGGAQTNINGAASANAPVQEFDINFVNTGTHYLYVRHQSPNGNDNSYTYLFDGVKQQEIHINTFSPTEWRFYDNLPTINVPSTGIHTLSIAMREDGTPIDHVAISSSPAYNTTTLPVELLALTGEAYYDHNLIYWATASERNTAYHHVERSLTGLDDWEPISSTMAAGNSEEVIDYEFYDRHPADLAYYRIVTEDMDGTSTLSSVISVTRAAKASQQLTIYPNPAVDHTNISFALAADLQVKLRIMTLDGREVAERDYAGQAGTNTVDLPVNNLPNGSYMVAASVPGKNLMVSPLLVAR